MTTVCTQTPTATHTDTVLTGVSFTTVTEVLSVLPGTDVSTSLVSTCVPPTGGTVCIPSISTVLVTAPGPTTLVQVPLTVIGDTVAILTTTLFGSSCTVITGPFTPVPVPPSSISVTTPRVTPGKGTSSSMSLTAPASSGTIAPAQATNSAGKKLPIGAIAGGAAAGLTLFVALAWLGWHYFHKSQLLKYNRDQEDSKKHSDTDSYGKFKEDPCVDQKECQPPKDHYGELQHSSQAQATNNLNNQAMNSTSTEQNQNQNSYQYDHDRHRLPRRMEEALQQKIDERMNPPSLSPAQIAAGVAAMSGLGMQQNQQYQSHNQPQSGFPQPTVNNALHGPGSPYRHSSQPSYTGSITGPQPGQQWTTPSLSLAQTGDSQYNVAAPGQASYGQQVQYEPHLNAGQPYRGYAEPSSDIPPTRPLSQ